MASTGKSQGQALVSSLGDDDLDDDMTIVDNGPVAAAKYKPKAAASTKPTKPTISTAVAVSSSSSRNDKMLQELDSQMAEFDVLVKAGEVIDQLEKAAVKSGHVKGEDIDREYQPHTFLRRSQADAVAAAEDEEKETDDLARYPCNGDCAHADGSGCDAACARWKQQWHECVELIRDANAFHTHAVRSMLPSDTAVQMHTESGDDIYATFVKLYAESNELNRKSGQMNEYNQDLYLAKNAFNKHAYAVMTEQIASAFMTNRKAIKSQVRPLRAVAGEISQLSRALMRSMGADDWIAGSATAIAEHVTRCRPDQWQKHIHTMEHTGELLIEAAQSMFRLAGDATSLAKHLRFQSDLLGERQPPLPDAPPAAAKPVATAAAAAKPVAKTTAAAAAAVAVNKTAAAAAAAVVKPQGTVGNPYWLHTVQSGTSSLRDLDIWGNSTHGICQRGRCTCDDAKASGGGGGNGMYRVSHGCCENCCKNCKNLYSGGDGLKRSLRAFLDLQPHGNLLVYTGAVFFRDCYTHLRNQLRDDADSALRISQGFNSLGEAMTQQHFVVLVGSYFLRLLHKPPATPSIVGRQNASTMPIDIMQVLFGPQFVSDLDDNARMEIRMELAARGPGVEGKLRTYLGQKYISTHLDNIQIAARGAFSTELDTLLDILFAYNEPAAAAADKIKRADETAEEFKSRRQKADDAADMCELNRRHIETNLKEFRTLLLTAVDYMGREAPTAQYCAHCSPAGVRNSNAQHQHQHQQLRQQAAAAAAPVPNATALTRSSASTSTTTKKKASTK